MILCTLILESSTISRTQIIMATFINISLDEKYKNHIEKGFDIMKDVDFALSSYNKESPIYMLNRDKKAKIGRYTYEALLLSQKLYKNSNFYFDITIGSITKNLYHFGEDERVPTAQELESAKVDFMGISFNENEAYLENGITLDFGGMGKGFGVDKVAQYFRDEGIDSARISASGDIRCLDICSVDIKSPFKDAILASFKTSAADLGITTSGNYNRYVLSTKNNHLINPKSKKSQLKFISITLVGKLSSTELDAYATAISVMPIKKAYEFLDSLDVSYLVLQSDGKLKVSSNSDKYINNLIVNYAIKK